MSAPGPEEADLEALTLRLCAARGAGRSVCPSEIARAAAGPGGNWRVLVIAVRAVAKRLADSGRIVVLQKGRPVDIARARGPVRLATRSH